MSDEDDKIIKGFDDISSDEDETVIEKRGFYSKIANTFKQFTGSKVTYFSKYQIIYFFKLDSWCIRFVADSFEIQRLINA